MRVTHENNLALHDCSTENNNDIQLFLGRKTHRWSEDHSFYPRHILFVLFGTYSLI